MIYNIDNQNVLAFSTERGFVDKDMPYDGFNITYYTDDDAEHIAQCRYDLRQMLEVADDHLILPRQHRIWVISLTGLTHSSLPCPALASACRLPTACLYLYMIRARAR